MREYWVDVEDMTASEKAGKKVTRKCGDIIVTVFYVRS